MSGSSAGDLVRAAVLDWSPCGVWPVRFECVGGACGCGVAVMSSAALRWVYNRGVCRQKQENSARAAPLSPPTVDPCVPVALARAYLSATPPPRRHPRAVRPCRWPPLVRALRFPRRPQL